VSRTYAARRAALVAAVARHLPSVALEGVDAGLHVVLRLPEDVDDLEVVTRLAALGLAASPLSAYAVEAPVRGLVLCYAGLPETRADAAVRTLADGLRGGGRPWSLELFPKSHRWRRRGPSAASPPDP
jgi:GntR family transcriptional regulator/MocR family aminotransferase